MTQLLLSGYATREDTASTAVRTRGLRWYQDEAFRAVHAELAKSRSTLVVMATGTGKTRLFAETARLWPGRVLVIVHRDELLKQAHAELERSCGECVEIEKAELRAGAGRLVVASVQSLKGKRLKRFRPDHFGLIIIDECHHSSARSYVAVLDHFKAAKVLGVTATPDRGDKMSLARVFDACAYKFDIQAGVEAGYLVPLSGMTVSVEAVDISGVSTSQGDLAQGELDEAVLKATEGIAKEALRVVPATETAIVFTPGVKSAHAIADRINDLAPGTAVALDGGTPAEDRARIVGDFKAKRVRMLVNCAIATEGFDAPHVSHVVMARPTKSRALYCQMVGRGTRVLPGVVDHIPGRDGADERKAAIAASAKASMVIVDLVGNAGKHSLVGPVDVLGDGLDDELKAAVKKRLREQKEDIETAIKASRQEIAAYKEMQRVKMESLVKSRQASFDPFEILHMKAGSDDGTPATSSHVEALIKLGVKREAAADMTAGQARKMIGTLHLRKSKNLASMKQLALLRKFGIDKPNIGIRTAIRLIDAIAANRWKALPAEEVERMMTA